MHLNLNQKYQIFCKFDARRLSLIELGESLKLSLVSITLT